MKTNMRSFSAAALVLTALLSESLSAQSERSRQRSGPIRSVPVAADIKRDVNFDCPEEFGYYPHPTDCTLYYVCVFGGALLESCTGGLMYSHELQTCDWPRNVGCDGASAAATGEEELERLIERDPPPPPPPPPRRTPPPSPPPPPPRAQPNPVVTSRGQPKFNRQEYEKQQQLYAEVDDLPPVEEIENDRQQRVYRGQPSTIGQVQKDRDGYGSQVVSSRTLNSNIIPASISQNSAKVGSFSFGTQVDERRAATATPIPQTYSEDKSDNVTDSSHDRQSDIETNNINIHDISDKYKSRKKREVLESVGLSNDSANGTEKITNRNDGVMEYEEVKPLEDEDFVDQEDVERGKRQIRYYTPKGYKNPSKNSGKPIRFVDFQQFNYNPNIQGSKYQPQYNGLSNTNGLSNYHDGTRKPYSSENNFYSTANPFVQYQQDSNQSQKPFKASLPDPFSQRLPHAPMNVATQIITKSPPISSLQNKENLFSSLAGGFFNNVKNVGNNQDNQNNNQYSQFVSSTSNPNNQVSLKDSSLLPSTIVTDKPVKTHTTSRVRSKYRIHPSQNANAQTGRVHIRNGNGSQKQIENRPPNKNQDYDDNDDDEEEEDDEDSDEDSDKEDEDDGYKHDFPEPPYEYTHYKFPEIENPFADPNFDFDAFLAKLRGDHYATIHEENETPKPSPKPNQNVAVKIINAPTDNTTPLTPHSGVRSSTLNYHGMSTPRPFSVPTGPEGVTVQEQNDHSTQSNTKHSQKFQKLIELPHPTQQNYVQHQHQTFDDNIHNKPHNPGIPLEAIIPKLKPPNFKDDRQLPITYNFQQSVSSTFKPNSDKQKGETRQMFTITQKPYIFITSTGSPIAISSPKQQFMVNPEKFLSLHPHLISSGKPYLFSTVKPHNALLAFKQSTTKPLTTLANEQLAALQYYWKNPTTEFYINSSPRPQTVSELPKLENLFAQAIKSAAKIPTRNQNYPSPVKDFVTTTTKPTTKRRPIPKPSPEMNDYYYDDEDEQYYYEPPVKSKYMPSTEIKPQRPPMAQNYQEYEDYEDSEESPENNKPLRTSYGRPAKYNSQKPDTATKNHNDVSVVTKSPLKDNKYFNGKIPVPVMIGYNTPAPNVLLRPDISNYQLIHPSRNRTIHFRKPMYSDSSPYTAKPPKYLNQTTLRPYTVRHRLAKPTTVKDLTTTEEKQIRGRIRHHNLVAMKLTTPRDNHNQETRFTKTKHDDKTNSLEPTAVTPSSFSASPRPKMLYNGSQSYNPDQYDPVYAVYDEDGELYKDSVQQTYRGTPPPRRPAVQNYTPRPLQEDYDDALIHGQINNQNQYQAPIRHSTRGDGNELGYDHNPSSAKTTIYEATSISTTPSTTSTSTTQRPTTAPFTEAMIPSRYTPRSSTVENPIRLPSSSSSETRSDGSAPPILTSPSPLINFSSLAKPFEKTDNSYRLHETLTSTEKIPNFRLPFRVTNNTDNEALVGEVSSNQENEKKVVSLTTGFSIRRNPNNTHNPYTLTVITRPFDKYNNAQHQDATKFSEKPVNTFSNEDISDRETSIQSQEDTIINSDLSSENSLRRKDSNSEFVREEEDQPIYVRPVKPKLVVKQIKPRIKLTPTTSPSTTKYYLKTVIKRPAPFGANQESKEDSTENIINTDVLIETGLQNARTSSNINFAVNDTVISNSPKWNQYSSSEEVFDKPTVSPYRALDNLRSVYDKKEVLQDYTTSTTSTTLYTTPAPKNFIDRSVGTEEKTPKSYYSYRIVDEEIPDHTTEVLSGTVKNIIKAFLNNIASPAPRPRPVLGFTSTTPFISTTRQPEDSYKSLENSQKFQNLLTDKPSTVQSLYDSVSYNNDDNEVTRPTKPIPEISITPTEIEWNRPTNKIPEIATTTSTTKSTTVRVPLTSTTKSLSFPTRASRVNPAIKLAATNPGGGRRSYQSSSKCSSDNSLQANPKCNEIKYQRPTSNRGRGSAHYSTLIGSDSPQQQTSHRGTPPTRSRPTLKPSTSVVTNNNPIIDIYANPPRRPAPVYPQPTPDKTAAKCRKDVCLLPDCFCGGKDIPGDLPVESVPQIVLLTFDDSVNDLNKGLYADLFEKDRVNPNGCPIAATFYVSHEWTDYSQVQNLYASGHEMASHTISHSFGEQFSQKKWNREVGGQREILSAYGGVKLEDVRGMRAPFLSVGGNKMFKMLHDSNFTYDSSLPVYENRPPSWPYTLDYKLFHDCMIPPCPTKSYPGVWEVPMVMWQDLNGGRCSMGDACANPPDAEGVYKMILKNFDRHYTTNRAPFGLYYHAAWFTQPHHKEGFIMFLDFINQMPDVWIVTNWQALQWVRDPTPISRLNNFQPFQCNYQDRPRKCNNPKVCNLWHKSGVRYMRTCQPCPDVYPWTGKTGIRSSRIDNEIEE
ncbi:uncharacterized protein LOC113230481 isoform X4 [Hyposmocoma kahamanoa]|uniref:uncharacterized protein LOC113230481 isoform X4 n=1 Tax=Hyposmocoma kahamanoa TaxID=1477025 RepID=UPI000E6DA206|nr:uncharacterized protein LOC113230481 isoform X4 [Hyposmocoma kahamanoa]